MNHLMEFLKRFKHLTSSGIHIAFQMNGSFLGRLLPREEEKSGESFLLGFHGDHSYDYSPLIYTLWECEVFTKTFIIMYISTNVH